MDELAAWITLLRTPGMHAGALRPLLHELSSPIAIVRASARVLRALGASRTLIEHLESQRNRDVSADLRWLEAPDRQFIALTDSRYPPLLAHIPDAPVGLYVRGDASVLAAPQLAIVGSRNPTPVGRENAARFAAQLARCGLAITSGLAVGVDAASHIGALEARGATIAVCGAGLDTIYPRANASLAERIAESGALVSEFPVGAPPLRSHFPRRNRIISGLALGVLVVEAAVRSGSLITARLANEQGREVFAIPGGIHNALARGCHELIRQGAKLVETADDVLAELGPLAGAAESARAAAPRRQENSGPALDKGYEILLDALGFEPAGVDTLIARSGLKADEVASMLLMLELEGRIESCPGGLYVRRSPAFAERLKAEE